MYTEVGISDRSHPPFYIHESRLLFPNFLKVTESTTSIHILLVNKEHINLKLCVLSTGHHRQHLRETNDLLTMLLVETFQAPLH